jgi:hypothetical protein
MTSEATTESDSKGRYHLHSSCGATIALFVWGDYRHPREDGDLCGLWEDNRASAGAQKTFPGPRSIDSMASGNVCE